LLKVSFRLATASILAVFVYLTGAMSVDAAPPPGTLNWQACANAADPTAARPFTLDRARACAPGAQVLPASTPVSRDGTFIVQRGRGYEVISRSTKPDTSRKAGDPCFIGSATVIDGGGIVEFLSAYLCYNYSVAWAYGVQANCYTLIPGFWCLARYSGTFGNYTNLAGAWGNYYNIAGFFPMNTGIRLDVQPNGRWWAWSYDCGSTC
jgi:hypothetical protein